MFAKLVFSNIFYFYHKQSVLCLTPYLVSLKCATSSNSYKQNCQHATSNTSNASFDHRVYCTTLLSLICLL